MADYKAIINDNEHLDAFITCITKYTYNWITVSIARHLLCKEVKSILHNNGMVTRKTYDTTKYCMYCNTSIMDYIPSLDNGIQIRTAVLVMRDNKIVVNKRFIEDNLVKSHVGYANGKNDIVNASKHAIKRDLGVRCNITELKLYGHGDIRHPFMNGRINTIWIYVIAHINEEIPDSVEYNIKNFNSKCIKILRHPNLNESLQKIKISV